MTITGSITAAGDPIWRLRKSPFAVLILTQMIFQIFGYETKPLLNLMVAIHRVLLIDICGDLNKGDIRKTLESFFGGMFGVSIFFKNGFAAA